MTWTVDVDGQPWSFSNHHGLDSAGEDNFDSHKYEYNRMLLSVYTVCTPGNPPPPGRGLTPGHHQATLQGTLEHADITLPPLSVEFELSCAPPATDAGTGDDDVTDGGTGDADPIRGPSSDGCTQAGGGLTVLGLLATLKLWRRKT